ncbi:MAG TPA: hypothetical protein VKF62_04655 [Planctomycetota bacterium]|nr:hypothetical protein [Planctomycetota bacterium]
MGRCSARECDGRNVLELDVAAEDRVDSICLVSVDVLLGTGDPPPTFVRLPFTEVGASTGPGFRRGVSLAIDRKAVPPGTYLMFVVTDSGAPSAGELLVVEPDPSGG